MTSTRILNVYKDGSWTVKIGRPSKWGNPYPLRSRSDVDVVTCLLAYAKHLKSSGLIDMVGELKGQVLGCYCKPARCHGDILVACADADDAKEVLDGIIKGLETELEGLEVMLW